MIVKGLLCDNCNKKFYVRSNNGVITTRYFESEGFELVPIPKRKVFKWLYRFGFVRTITKFITNKKTKVYYECPTCYRKYKNFKI